jgi:cyclopropane fatty-acyl-phospholipid synthase-like methyltransferase
MRVLDVRCGSGEFCAQAAALGATASGIDAAVPYEVADQATLERALLIDAAGFERAAQDEVRRAVLGATARYRRPDGSYRFDNRFRYLIATA